MLDQAAVADCYASQGYVVLPGFMARHVALAWSVEAREKAQERPYDGHDVTRPPGPKVGLDEGEGRSYWAMDGLQVMRHYPGLWGAYDRLPPRIAPIVGREIICSPYPRSAITVKVYREGDWHGAHRDSQPVTALLYLDDAHGASTLIGDTQVDQNAGDLLVMAGRDHVHAVPVHTRARAVIAFNLYHPDDVWRPEWYDTLVYGG